MAFPKSNISAIIASSLTRAQYEYYEMTGKKGFLEISKSIPEKVLEVAAARSCYQHLRGSGHYIIQEFQFSLLNDVAKNVYGIKDCRKFEGDMRRLDVVVKSESGKIEAILEIKRKISGSGFHQSVDIERLLEIKEYFHERADEKIEALFAYPITFNFANEEELSTDKMDCQETAEAIFGKKYSLSIGEYRVKFPEGEFYFCFGAVCGRV